MRSHYLFAAVFACCLFAAESSVARTPTGPYTMVEIEKELTIRPLETHRRGAGPQDVRRVLLSTAREQWRYFPDERLEQIDVRLEGGPMVIYNRGPQGEYTVLLDVEKTFWAQYAYQFSHEFTHILCRYKKDRRQQKWFEESICELGSIFAIRAMARSWQTDPPYDHWRDFSKSLRKYSDDLLEKGRLPDGVTFIEWFAANRDELAAEACDRPRNTIVACRLLPFFEASPEHWKAVWYLNDGLLPPAADFELYLNAWLESTPAAHHDFIRKIAAEFEITLKE